MHAYMHVHTHTNAHTETQAHSAYMYILYAWMHTDIHTERQTHTCRVWWISLGKFFNVQIGICLSGGSCVDE